MDDVASKLTLADLIAFGCDYLQALEEPHKGVQLPMDLLKQYLIRANEALALLQSEQDRKRLKKSGSTGGRPPGGMGEQVMRLHDNGMGLQSALRIVSKESRKPREKVLRAYNSARKKHARKKPPT